MTQEEKELLIVAICNYLPYKPILINKELSGGYPQKAFPGYLGLSMFLDSSKIDNTAIFLRPMSSMTGEELKELVNLNLIRINSYKRDFVIKETEFFLDICWYVQIAYKDNNGDECVTNLYVGRGSSIEEIDWLNKKHFDYRGLIPMGLALEAPKDMYNN